MAITHLDAVLRFFGSAERNWLVPAILFVSIGLSGCVSQSTSHSHPANGSSAFSATPSASAAATQSWIRTELYFGLSIPPSPDGSPAAAISEAQWQQFVDEVISPRFPDGLTVLHATGQWRSRPADGHPVGVVHEDSRVVIIFHQGPTETPSGGKPIASEDEVRIEQIRAAYKARFRQDSVMRTDSVLRVEF